MTPQQISKVWTVVSLFLLYYALNTYLVVQGGNPMFGATLIVLHKTPAAMLAIPICSLLLFLSAIIGIGYARKQRGRWADRIPVVGFESLDVKSREAKIYQAVMLCLFNVVPLISIAHFWSVISSAKVYTTGKPQLPVESIWSWWPTLESLNDPARICTSVKEVGPTPSDISCEGNITILPGLEPTLFAIVTLLAIIAVIWFGVRIFHRQPAILSGSE
jgi:hypothetical protein